MGVLKVALQCALTAGGIAVFAPPPTIAAGYAGVLFGACDPIDSFDSLSPQSVGRGATIGATVDFGRAEWPVHVSVSATTCSAEGVALGMQTDTNTDGFSTGAQWYPRKAKPGAQPFLGGGLSFLSLRAELQTITFGDPVGIAVVDDRDTSWGGNIHGGAFSQPFDGRWRLGVDLRYSVGSEANLLSQPVDMKVVQLSLLAGIQWGREARPGSP